MSFRWITLSVSEGIATLTLNRPEKCNALHGEFIQELSRAFLMIAEDKHAQVVLIQGQGKHFCAGADIDWMHQVATSTDDINQEEAKHLADMLYRLYTCPQPTIVLAHGTTVGGGLGLLSASDIAISTHTARFGFSEVKLGLAPSTISPYVVSAMGERAARYYFLTGERFDVAEAHRLGLVHRCVEEHALLSTGVMMAKALAEQPLHAMTAIKTLLHDVSKAKITAQLSQKTAEHLACLRRTPETKQKLVDFMNRK